VFNISGHKMVNIVLSNLCVYHLAMEVNLINLYSKLTGFCAIFDTIILINNGSHGN
jgi:hypothetical protein